MILARVVGTVVATRKDPRLEGKKLLVLKPINPEGKDEAGYVVAVVNFPRTDCRVGTAAYEPDLVNQPADMSYVLSRLLALSAQPHGLLSGRLSRHEIAAAGQSDGGDTVAALAANACCTDHRLAAVAFSGDGKTLAAGDSDGTTYLWRTGT